MIDAPRFIAIINKTMRLVDVYLVTMLYSYKRYTEGEYVKMGKITKSSLALGAVLLAGCAVALGDDSYSESGLRTSIMFNGSSTLAPTISAIAADFNEQYGTWNMVNPDFPEEPISIFVASGGSGQGIRTVIDQTTDFGMLARGVRDSEIDQIPDFQEFLVGIDALTISINPENPFLQIRDDLTREEIVRIFSGEYERWSDLYPTLPDEEIVVIVRDIGGGAHEVFQSNIMGDVDVKATAIQAPSMGALVSRIIENRYAIGYASYGISNQNAGSLAMLRVDGVEASTQNIIDGSYVIQRPLILVHSGELDYIQQAFLDVVLGEVGQEAVRQMGFIPIN